jgi:hypothetical protein
MWLNTISERTVKNSSLKVMICVKKITGLQIIQMGVSSVIFVTKRMLIQEP